MIYFVHRHTKFRPVPTGLNHVCLVLQGASRVAERLLAISIREHHTSLFTPITMFYSFPLVSVNCGSVRYGFANLRETSSARDRHTDEVSAEPKQIKEDLEVIDEEARRPISQEPEGSCAPTACPLASLLSNSTPFGGFVELS